LLARQQLQSIGRYHRAIDSRPQFWCDVYVQLDDEPCAHLSVDFLNHTKEHYDH